jgi:hypothetical protein
MKILYLRKYRLLFLFMFLLAEGCKPKASIAPESVELSQGMAEKADLKIGFYSVAYGIDVQTLGIISAMLAVYEEDKKITVQKYGWGREGEVDVCIYFNQLNEEEKLNLTSEIRNVISEGRNIRLSIFSTCKK